MIKIYNHPHAGQFLKITRREAHEYFNSDCMILVTPALITPLDYETINKYHCISKTYNRKLSDYIDFLHRMTRANKLSYYIPVKRGFDNVLEYRPLERPEA